MNNNSSLLLDMQGHVIEQRQDSPFLVFRLSWVAYAREVWSFLVRLILCCLLTAVLSLGLDRFAHMHTEAWLPALGLLGAVALTVYSVMQTNAVRLFTDENGVWVQSGVLPWQKGVTGVQWRDIGHAGFNTGFASWALRSYDLHITHRFTTGTELSLRNVHRGNLAVEHINAIMARLQGRVMPA